MRIDNDDKSINADFSSDSQLSSNFNSNSSDISLNTENQNEDVQIAFESSPDWNVIFELSGGGGNVDNKILYNTTEYWNSHRDLITKRGYIYIYSDYQMIDDKNVAGIKIGDGSTCLIDMPFIDKLYYDHVHDMVSHITQAEREFWNNKVRCYASDNHTLVFTKN